MERKVASTYADAGVDIDKGNAFASIVKGIAKKTKRPGSIGEIGGFGGLFSLKKAGYAGPNLVSSTDGVGTKLKIAFMTGKHNTVGIDLVAMCVNDIIVQGAEPLFFLDYFATGKLDLETSVAVVEGIAEGCLQADCELIGGETAEMPGLYSPGEYDLAGFAVGALRDNRLIDGSRVYPGVSLIGLASSGLHSNGYSLVRKICFEDMGLGVEDVLEECGCTLGEELLRPTRIYVKAVRSLMEKYDILGMAHITGGGLIDNIPRMLPDYCQAIIHRGSWHIPPIFGFIQEHGNIEQDEMLRTFNNGIGYVIAVSKKDEFNVFADLSRMGEMCYVIGHVADKKEEEKQVVFV